MHKCEGPSFSHLCRLAIWLAKKICVPSVWPCCCHYTRSLHSIFKGYLLSAGVLSLNLKCLLVLIIFCQLKPLLHSTELDFQQTVGLLQIHTCWVCVLETDGSSTIIVSFVSICHNYILFPLVPPWKKRCGLLLLLHSILGICFTLIRGKNLNKIGIRKSSKTMFQKFKKKVKQFCCLHVMIDCCS